MAPSLRSPVLRGSVLADGFLFESSIVPTRVARRRILDLWRVGARIFRLPRGLVLILPVPVRVRAEAAPGAPLVRSGTSYQTMPAGAFAAAPPPAASLVHMVSGVVETVALPAVEEEPALWLRIAEIASLAPLEPLGEPVAARDLPPPAPEPESDVHALLGPAVPGPDARRAAVLATLLAAAGGGSTQGNVSGAARAGTALGIGLVGALGRLFGWLLRGRATRSGNGGVPANRRVGTAERQPLPPAPLTGWWRRLLLRMVMFTRLARVLGQRQAAYLARTIRLFEEGDLEEALRHAIPLGAMETALTPALGLPARRPSLELSLTGGAATSAIAMGIAPYEYLRQLYRSAFERLDRADRVEEAAFVLAELLHADAEAVAYLERRDRLRLAAELAEGRRLPAGLVVRQWFLAGDRRRAVRIARQQGAFFDAVTRLATSHPQEAEALRLTWADALASAGDYAGAVDAIWPVASARALALAWIDRAIALGEEQAPRMLARKVAVAGAEKWDEVAGQAKPLLDATDPNVALARLLFLQALAKEDASDAACALVRAVLRAALLADSRPWVLYASGLHRQLLEWTRDRDLRTDLPALPPITTARPGRDLIELVLADRGVAPVHDVAVLPSGRALLALGEAGVRLVGAKGNLVHRFGEPASRLVVSVHGDRALALARRGEALRIALLDLHDRTSRHLADLRLDAFATSYDGETWWVAQAGAIAAIDLIEPGLPCRYRVSDLGRVLGPVWSPAGVAFLATSDGLEQFDYELPSFTLRRRAPILLLTDPAADGTDLAPVLPLLGAAVRKGAGTVVAQFDPRSSTVALCCFSESGRQEIRLEQPRGGETPGASPWPGDLRLAGDGARVAVTLPCESGTEVLLLALPTLKPTARIRLPGSRRVCVRLEANTLEIGDDRGQAAVIDLESGTVRKRFVV
jgi:hypothetical protein